MTGTLEGAAPYAASHSAGASTAAATGHVHPLSTGTRAAVAAIPAGQAPNTPSAESSSLWKCASQSRGITGELRQETTSESTRGQRRSSADPGPRRPNGDDRLMDKVQAHPDTAPAICPICGAWPAACAVRLDNGISIGDYRDDQGHIWTTKWVAA